MYYKGVRRLRNTETEDFAWEWLEKKGCFTVRVTLGNFGCSDFIILKEGNVIFIEAKKGNKSKTNGSIIKKGFRKTQYSFSKNVIDNGGQYMFMFLEEDEEEGYKVKVYELYFRSVSWYNEPYKKKYVKDELGHTIIKNPYADDYICLRSVAL